MKFSFSKRLIDHTIQAVLIFASVFLAFMLSDFRDTRIQQNILKASLQNIASEMAYNHARIEKVYQYHVDVLHQIDSIRENGLEDEIKYGYELPRWKGVELPLLRSTAYQTYINTGIHSQGEFEIAKTLADVYNVQSIIERIDDSFFDIATSDRSFTELDKVWHLSGLYVEILPGVIFAYQDEGKKWLEEYGYDNEVEEKWLKKALENG